MAVIWTGEDCTRASRSVTPNNLELLEDDRGGMAAITYLFGAVVVVAGVVVAWGAWG